MPCPPRAGFSLAQRLAILRAKLGYPAAHCLVADVDATLGEQLLDISETEWKAQVEPDRVRDDRTREVAPRYEMDESAMMGLMNQRR
jgi:hypothetical protein